MTNSILHSFRFPAVLILSVYMGLLMAFAAPQHDVLTAEQAEPGQTIVLGRLNVLQDGKGIKWNAFLERVAHILIARQGSSNALVHDLTRSDGMFFWALEPGDYVLAGLAYRKGDVTHTLHISGQFKVPQETRGIYIGTLKVLTMRGRYSPRIEDEHTSAFEAFRKEFPGREDPVTDLIHLQTRIGTYKQKMHVCAPGWGIECTKKYHGITPLEPEVKPESFPEVGSLTPTFMWQGSSLQDVSYDIAIYQDLTYKFRGVMHGHIAGPVVAYSEGLTEPEYHPSAPLEPGRKYHWSVRLRHGDVVSTWSSVFYSHFTFRRFAATTGQSPWFGFSTPAD